MVGPCRLCNRAMSLSDLQDGVYWLPYVPFAQRYWVLEGFENAEHIHVHRRCWGRLKEKHRRRIRKESWPGQEPRSQDGWV